MKARPRQASNTLADPALPTLTAKDATGAWSGVIATG